MHYCRFLHYRWTKCLVKHSSLGKCWWMEVWWAIGMLYYTYCMLALIWQSWELHVAVGNYILLRDGFLLCLYQWPLSNIATGVNQACQKEICKQWTPSCRECCQISCLLGNILKSSKSGLRCKLSFENDFATVDDWQITVFLIFLHMANSVWMTM